MILRRAYTVHEAQVQLWEGGVAWLRDPLTAKAALPPEYTNTLLRKGDYRWHPDNIPCDWINILNALKTLRDYLIANPNEQVEHNYWAILERIRYSICETFRGHPIDPQIQVHSEVEPEANPAHYCLNLPIGSALAQCSVHNCSYIVNGAHVEHLGENMLMVLNFNEGHQLHNLCRQLCAELARVLGLECYIMTLNDVMGLGNVNGGHPDVQNPRVLLHVGIPGMEPHELAQFYDNLVRLGSSAELAILIAPNTASQTRVADPHNPAFYVDYALGHAERLVQRGVSYCFALQEYVPTQVVEQMILLILDVLRGLLPVTRLDDLVNTMNNYFNTYAVDIAIRYPRARPATHPLQYEIWRAIGTMSTVLVSKV